MQMLDRWRETVAGKKIVCKTQNLPPVSINYELFKIWSTEQSKREHVIKSLRVFTIKNLSLNNVASDLPHFSDATFSVKLHKHIENSLILSRVKKL